MAEVFETSTINLSMRGSDGRRLTANVYQLDGVQNADGSLRALSIGQLVLAICLNRATELEAAIVERMDAMSANSDELEIIADLEQHIVDAYANNASSSSWNASTWAGLGYTSADQLPSGQTLQSSWCDWWNGKYSDNKVTSKQKPSESEVQDWCSALEQQMDALNSISQETLIDIQSLTSKRDDAYSLSANVLKSLNTVMTGIVNNL